MSNDPPPLRSHLSGGGSVHSTCNVPLRDIEWLYQGAGNTRQARDRQEADMTTIRITKQSDIRRTEEHLVNADDLTPRTARTPRNQHCRD